MTVIWSDYNFQTRIVILGFGFLEMLLYSGIVFGWEDMVFVYKELDVFGNFCNHTNTSLLFQGEIKVQCKDQDKMFESIFTLASLTKGGSGLLIAYILDKHGLSFSRKVAKSLIFVGGCFLLTCNEDHPYLLFPGAIFIGLGGNQLRMSNFQISNLFPKHKTTIMTLYTGAFCGSAMLPLLFRYGSTSRFPINWILLTWTVLPILLFLMNDALLPKDRIELASHLIPEEKIEIGPTEEQPLGTAENIQDNYGTMANKGDPESPKSLKSIVLSPSFLIHMYFSSMLGFGVMLFNGNFNPWIETTFKGSKSFETNISLTYGWSQLIMLPIAPLAGILMDYAVKKAKTEKDIVRAGFSALFLSSLVATLMCVCKLFQTKLAVYLGLAAYILSRPLTNAVNPGYMKIRFPEKQFNKLLGIQGTVVAIFSLFQYGFYEWISSHYESAMACTLVLVTLTFSNSIHLFFVKI